MIVVSFGIHHIRVVGFDHVFIELMFHKRENRSELKEVIAFGMLGERSGYLVGGEVELCLMWTCSVDIDQFHHARAAVVILVPIGISVYNDFTNLRNRFEFFGHQIIERFAGNVFEVSVREK